MLELHSLSFLKFVLKKEIIKDFTIYEHRTTIRQPHMQLRGEKNSYKNSESCIIVTLNVDTNFMFDFFMLQQSSTIKLITSYPHKVQGKIRPNKVF